MEDITDDSVEDVSDENTVSDEDDVVAIIDEDELGFRGGMRHRFERNDQVERNDPGLLAIDINEDSVPNDRDWEEFGESIGRNTALKEITIDCFSGVGFQFFRGLAMNRSIEAMTLVDVYVEDNEILLSLIPFFKNNQAFECLCVEYTMQENVCLRTLAFVLGQFDSLKEFKLSDQNTSLFLLNDESELIQALAGHVGLRKISLQTLPIGRGGFTALATLLQNPRSNLKVLDLQNNEINDGGAVILSTGLSSNNTLTELNLGGNRNIRERGWQAISDVLENPSCRLEKLHLNHNFINDTVAVSLSNALRNNNTLTTLYLNPVLDVTISAWRDLFAGLLQRPNCALECLDLDGNELNDDIIESLTTAMANNSSLRVLNLCNIRGVTPARWEGFSIILQNTMLDKLYLRGNRLTDNVMVSLADALANNTRLRELDLHDSRDVTTIGWQAFSTCLQSPNTVLEKLDISYGVSSDHIVSCFADVLKHNNKLKELIFDHHLVTSDGYAAVTHILCNKSTILNTYHSNHTLEKFGQEIFDPPIMLPEDLSLLLRINRDYSRCQAARLKILMVHFSGSDINLQTFTKMDSIILPVAIAWMAKGEDVTSNELSLLYRFIRAMPALLE